MTISEMTNDELDRMIAEKKLRPLIAERMHTEHDIDLATERLLEGSIRPYSTDPRYAMELLKEMADTGGLIEIDKVGKDYRICFSDFIDVITEGFYRAIAIKWMEWAK